MGKPRRSFTPEFKQEAVDLCRRTGKSECQVARELGIPQSTLNRWMRQAAVAPLGSNSFLATEELKVVRRELEQIRMERDILKKAVAFPKSRHEVSVHPGGEGVVSGGGVVSGARGGPERLLRLVPATC
jgi:transposase